MLPRRLPEFPPLCNLEVSTRGTVLFVVKVVAVVVAVKGSEGVPEGKMGCSGPDGTKLCLHRRISHLGREQGLLSSRFALRRR